MTDVPPPLSVRVRQQRNDFLLDVAFEGGAGITALFGPSGSGKTTILNIIAGTLRPDAGYVAVSSHVLTDTQADIFVPCHRRRVGFVFQDAQLFPHLTVEQNIKFGRWFVSMHGDGPPLDVVTRELGIGGLLKRRPATLSGGEKQRLAITRLLLKDPAIVILDEATSHLDAETEALVQEALGVALAGRTAVVIAHRLSTIHHADQILVVDGGRITQRGTHEELVQTGGLYAELTARLATK